MPELNIPDPVVAAIDAAYRAAYSQYVI